MTEAYSVKAATWIFLRHFEKNTSYLVFTTVTGKRVIPAIVLAQAPSTTDSPIVLSSLQQKSQIMLYIFNSTKIETYSLLST